ncbi:MAG: ethanolamine utilization phosphate acetyltransferase EutD [Clostridium sp.]|uniref:ethanolamine utilization phosphate acetyltransferase EutD n=1 Tax=Clostridium sp. TaxID=1506 RepID=UPI003F376A60
MKDLLNSIIDEVVKRVRDEAFIDVEASGRHVHLSEEDVERLFGIGYKLTKIKDLSQPGQFACKERVTIKGPKGSIKNVVVLGPTREESQVEVSLTDALALGIKPPIKISGEILNTPGVTVESDRATVNLTKGLIAAKRHIHLSREDAKKFEVKNNDLVKVKVFGERPLIFDDVVIRVSEKYKTFMHIDYDEANACGFKRGTFARIIK